MQVVDKSNVFIDCGANLGQGLTTFCSMYGMDASWIVETFEPNPLLIEQLSKNISSLPMNVKIHNSAVWCYDGEIEFSIMEECSEVSSIKKLMDDGVCLDISSLAYRSHNNIINVPCVDISSIIRSYKINDNIVVKIDVEGSEFAIIRKLIEDDTISYINDLYVEWHTQYMSSENFDTQNDLIQKILDKGVRHHFWH